MKERSTPGAWLFFGFIVHPLLGLINEFLGWIVFSPFLSQLKSWPDFGFGGVGALILGPPLGILTAIISRLIEKRKLMLARIFAVAGGAFGVWSVTKLAPPSVYTYTGDLGFVATPLIWSLALILFGFLVRTPRTSDENPKN